MLQKSNLLSGVGLSLFLLLALICCWGLPLSAQTHRLFYDDFTVERGRWTPSDSLTERFLAGGQLWVKQTKAGHTGSVLQEVLLKPRETFAFETQLTLNADAPNTHYGLIWNSSAQADHKFVWWIQPTGYFAIQQIKSGQETWLQGWTKHRKIKGSGESNIFRLEKRGWAWFFMINGKEVLELPYKPFLGNFHGLLLENAGTLTIDYFSVEHPPVEINLVDGPEQNARKARLDSTINSPDQHETSPVLSAQRRSLYFSRSAAPWTKGVVHVSHVLGDTAWGKPQPLRGLTSAGHSHLMQLDRSGNQGWLAAGTVLQTIRRRSDSTWLPGEQIRLGGTQLGHLTYWSLSEDEKTLVFAAERAGGYGDLDLYVSFRQGAAWSKPRNLGSNLNTYGRETSPWLAPDGETLYFSSEGHAGYGGGDVFRTRRLDNTWTRWAAPENLGPKINGPTWDLGYRPWEGRMDRAYMASMDSIRGDFDIYAIRIPEDLRTKPVVRVYGRLLHRRTEAALGGLVTAQDLSPDSLLIEHTTESGAYSFLVPYGRAYRFFGERVGYYATIDTLDVRPVTSYREIERDLYLSPIEVGETITLDRVFFQRASPLLLEGSYEELDELVRLMRAIPALEIEIQGHTDNRGTVDELQRLSEQRAATVREYLIADGITAARIRARGFGASRPIASNENPATRVLNRRVEFNILKR